MPRKPLIETDTFPYHIMNRSNNKEFFYLELEDLWSIFINTFCKIKKMYGCEFYSFVLMSNHYHLIMSTPNFNLSAAMTYLHREVAKRANMRAGRINHFFGGRYKWCSVDHDNYYWNAMKYVFRNPVEAGLCKTVESYQFSTLNNNDADHLWCMPDFFLDRTKTIELDLDWLNHKFKDEEYHAIKMGLRRRKFALPANKNGKKTVLDSMQRKKGLGT